MNILLKVYKYFIKDPVHQFIFTLAINSNKKIYKILFNFYSFLQKSPNRIYCKKEFFHNTEFDWRFFHKKQGLYSYGKGFQKRKEDLISSYLIKNLEIEDEDNIIDVGANNGDFYLCFDKKINYYGFEPSPIVFSNLEYNIKNQKIYNLGVSNIDNKNVEFYLNDEFGDSSIIPINNYSEKILIKTTTLDKIIDAIDGNIKLVKIEAEGLEPEILHGLNKNLNTIKYITIDCGFERGKEKKSTIAECSNFLLKKNFKMIDFSSPRIVCLYKNINFS